MKKLHIGNRRLRDTALVIELHPFHWLLQWERGYGHFWVATGPLSASLTWPAKAEL